MTLSEVSKMIDYRKYLENANREKKGLLDSVNKSKEHIEALERSVILAKKEHEVLEAKYSLGLQKLDTESKELKKCLINNLSTKRLMCCVYVENINTTSDEKTELENVRIIKVKMSYDDLWSIGEEDLKHIYCYSFGVGYVAAGEKGKREIIDSLDAKFKL